MICVRITYLIGLSVSDLTFATMSSVHRLNFNNQPQITPSGVRYTPKRLPPYFLIFSKFADRVFHIHVNVVLILRSCVGGLDCGTCECAKGASDNRKAARGRNLKLSLLSHGRHASKSLPTRQGKSTALEDWRGDIK